jgi:hypothetical protein
LLVVSDTTVYKQLGGGCNKATKAAKQKILFQNKEGKRYGGPNCHISARATFYRGGSASI